MIKGNVYLIERIKKYRILCNFKTMKHALFLLFALLVGGFYAQKKGKLTQMPNPTSQVFFENKGQWPAEVLFKSETEGGKIWVLKHKLIYHQQDLSAMNHSHGHEEKPENLKLKESLVHVNFVNAIGPSEILTENKTSFYHNYLLGKDSNKWGKESHGYERVVLKNMYPSVDLAFEKRQGPHKYEFIVRPNGKVSDIAMEYAGQQKITVLRNGNLKITTDLGHITENAPYAYQIVDGVKTKVQSKFVLKDNKVFFEMGSYNPFLELIIDPVLVFATYNGAFSDNFGMTATYSSNGSAFSAGVVYGNNFPMPAAGTYDPNSNFVALQGNYGITDVFITKYNPTGTNMLWSTFLGGGNMVQGTETAHSLICDSADNICVFGATSSIDFPTTAGAIQPNHAGGVSGADFLFNGVYFTAQGTDLYVSKVSANGQNLLASTYVGGSANDGVNYKIGSLPYNNALLYDSLTSNYGDQFRGEIMIDKFGNVLIASCTRSTNFPTMNPFQNNNAGAQDGVVFRMNPNFTALQFSSYYGGSQNDACYSVKVDTNANIFFCGGTSSTNLSGTVGGLMGSYQGGKSDGFVIRLNPSGNAITAGTYLGRQNYDQAFFVEVDRTNNVFVLGQSVGGIFPIWNAPYYNPNSSQFVIKLTNNLSVNQASGTIGNGSSQINISPSAFLVDICGNIYVSGWGANILQNVPISGMPISANAFQPNSTGFDFYLMVIEHDFNSLLYATYMGGPVSTEHVDGGTSRFDKNGVVYQSVCGGCGGNSDFPTTPGAWSSSNNSSNCNNLLFKFDFQLIPTAQFFNSQSVGCEDFEVTFNNFSSQNDSYLWDFGNNVTSTTVFSPTITYTEPGVYNVYLYVTDSVCALTDSAFTTITVYDSIQFNLFDTLSLCSNAPYLLTLQTFGTGTGFIWSQNANLSNPINANPNDSTLLLNSANPGWYYVSVTNGYCNRKDSVFVQFDIPIVSNYQPSPNQGCAPLTVQFNNSSTLTSNFYWNLGNGQIDSVNFEPSVTYSQPGQYQTQLIVFDSVCNAADTFGVTITVSASVSFTLPNAITLCSDSSFTLAPSGIIGGVNSFVWSSNPNFTDTLNASTQDSSLYFLLPSSGTYYLQVNNGPCSFQDSVSLTVFTDVISINGPDSVCLNVPVVFNAVNASQDPFTYQWSPSNVIQGSSIQSSVTVTPPQSQYIYLEATSSNGCVIEDSSYVMVSYINPALVDASANPILIEPNAQVSLSVQPGGYPSYAWVPAAPCANPTSQQTTATLQNTTIFTVYVSDGICTVSDTVEVKVYEIICDLPYVYVPNAFSPNGDQNNDILYVRGLFVEKLIFRVFDRWGEMVFETEDVNIGWDGIYQGKKLDPDVYDYYLKVVCYGGLEKITKGNITLMK